MAAGARVLAAGERSLPGMRRCLALLHSFSLASCCAIYGGGREHITGSMDKVSVAQGVPYPVACMCCAWVERVMRKAVAFGRHRGAEGNHLLIEGPTHSQMYPACIYAHTCRGAATDNPVLSPSLRRDVPWHACMCGCKLPTASQGDAQITAVGGAADLNCAARSSRS